jgi:exosome complex RNA-binding protein Rrp4
VTREELAAIKSRAEAARTVPSALAQEAKRMDGIWQDVPTLVAEVEQLQSLNRAVLHLLDQHHATDYTRLPSGAICPICSKHPQTLKAAAP